MATKEEVVVWKTLNYNTEIYLNVKERISIVPFENTEDQNEEHEA